MTKRDIYIFVADALNVLTQEEGYVIDDIDSDDVISLINDYHDFSLTPEEEEIARKAFEDMTNFEVDLDEDAGAGTKYYFFGNKYYTKPELDKMFDRYRTGQLKPDFVDRAYELLKDEDDYLEDELYEPNSIKLKESSSTEDGKIIISVENPIGYGRMGEPERYYFDTVDKARDFVKDNYIAREEVTNVSGCEIKDLFPDYDIQEEEEEEVTSSETEVDDLDDYESYWVLNNDLDWSGEGLFLMKNGTYKKCHYSLADQMTAKEAEIAFKELNLRLPRKARVRRFREEWM